MTEAPDPAGSALEFASRLLVDAGQAISFPQEVPKLARAFLALETELREWRLRCEVAEEHEKTLEVFADGLGEKIRKMEAECARLHAERDEACREKERIETQLVSDIQAAIQDYNDARRQLTTLKTAIREYLTDWRKDAEDAEMPRVVRVTYQRCADDIDHLLKGNQPEETPR